MDPRRYLYWLNRDKKYLVVYKLEPCISRLPSAVDESSDKMISNIPIHADSMEYPSLGRHLESKQKAEVTIDL
jgi:hypothetical protein